jgi:hypothetical protein
MNERESIECMNAEINACNKYYDLLAETTMLPSVVYRPKLQKDGNLWCALYGDDLMTGIVGFGKSPAKAMADFNKNWKQEES